MRRAVVVVAVAACWTGDEPAPRAPAAASRVVVLPGVARSLWIGTYTCAQGNTALELAIEEHGRDVKAVFTFGPLDANPSVPHGSFRMTGSVHRHDDGRRLVYELAPAEWIESPPGYVMVGLTAATSPDGRLLFGKIDGPGCTTLQADLAR